MYSPVACAVDVRAAPAKKRRLSMSNSISSGTAAIGLPTLRLSSATSSSWCSSMRSARRQSAVARSAGVVAAQPGKASVAAATARSMSAADEDATSAMVSPVAGSSTTSTPPSMPSRHSPPMKLPRIPVVTAAPSRRRGGAYPGPAPGRLATRPRMPG